MTECVICGYDDQKEDGQDIYRIERPSGEIAICEVCDSTPYICLDCDYRWMYGGNADLPTCSNCKGKRTQPIA